MLPGQRTGESNDKNTQNYEGEDEDDVTQVTKTGMNSGSKDLADNNKIKIIIDEPTFEGAIQGALDFQDYSKNLSNIIRETTPPQFAVGIFGKWGSGKTTLMKMIKQKLDEDNNRDKILTVWFDAWRYEREKYLAIIPFLRLIRIALDKDSDKKKNPKWRKVKKALQKTSTAFIESTDVSFAALDILRQLQQVLRDFGIP